MKSIIQYINETITYRGGRKIAYFDADKIGSHNGVSDGWGVYTFERKSETSRYVKSGSYISYVEVPEDNGFNYIKYWDKLTTKQKKVVTKGINDNYGEQYLDNLKKIVNMKGIDFYRNLSKLLKDDRKGRNTSEFLDSIGIIGMIKEHMGVKGDATYIIYNPKNAKIVKSEYVE